MLGVNHNLPDVDPGLQLVLLPQLALLFPRLGVNRQRFHLTEVMEVLREFLNILTVTVDQLDKQVRT